MKWIKICALLVVTLAVMRAGSWAVAWTLSRFLDGKPRAIAAAANLAAFAVFLLFLYFNGVPGEPIDVAAAVFGLVVYLTYTAMDLAWRPWARGTGRRWGGLAAKR